MAYGTEKSKALFDEAKKYLVGGIASSLHKSEDEAYPIYAASGKGCRILDVDGNEYVDFMGSFGPSILGFSNPILNQAVHEQVERGTHFAMPTESLDVLSKEIVRIMPGAEMVGFQSTGTEANLVALRLARAYTGRTKIVKFEGHYHGWADELNISVKPTSKKAMGPRSRPWKTLECPGQLESAADQILVLPWNDLKAVETIFRARGHEIAGVITEPIMYNIEPVFPQPGYLEGLRALTAQYGIVLIFDEVITGFRLALGGAGSYFGVQPDLSTFGKAVAGGYPISGVVGKRAVLECGVHPAGTFNANPLCVAAAIATLGELQKPGVYTQLSEIADMLRDGILALGQKFGVKLWCQSSTSIVGFNFGIDQPLRNAADTFQVDKKLYSKFYMCCMERGIRLHPFRGRMYISTAHTKADIHQTLQVFEEIFQTLF